MQSQTRTLSSLDAEEREAWRRLARRAVEPNPYFDIDFLLATHRRLRPDVDPQVAMVTSGGELRAVLPFLEHRRATRLPVVVRSTGVPLGATVLDLHTPLLDASCVSASLRALLAELGTSRAGLPVVVDLAVHRLEGPVWEALQALTAAPRRGMLVRGEQVRGVLRGLGPREARSAAREAGAAAREAGAAAREPWAVDRSVLAHLSRSRRRSLGRAMTALAAEVGPLTWVDRTEDPAAVAEFVAVEDAGWKGDVDQGGEGLVATAGGQAWFEEVTGRLRRAGQLYVGALYAGQRCVYLSVDIRTGDQLVGMRDVYEQSCAEHSPGTLGRLAELAWFTAHEPVFLDSGTNGALYPQVTALYPDRLRLGRVLVAANTSAALGFAALGLAERLQTAVQGRRRGAAPTAEELS